MGVLVCNVHQIHNSNRPSMASLLKPEIRLHQARRRQPALPALAGSNPNFPVLFYSYSAYVRVHLA